MISRQNNIKKVDKTLQYAHQFKKKKVYQLQIFVILCIKMKVETLKNVCEREVEQCATIKVKELSYLPEGEVRNRRR